MHIFSYNITENYLTSFAHNSVSKGPNNFKFGTKTLHENENHMSSLLVVNRGKLLLFTS